MRAAIMMGSMLLLGACDHSTEAKASGQGDQRSYQVAAFDRVSLAGAHDVIVTVGGAPSVRAVGDSETLDRLEIKVENGKLIVGDRHHGGWSFGTHKGKAVIYVTAPSLAGAAVAGSGDMKVDRAEGARFDAAVSGSGDLTLGSVKAEEASFALAGHGSLNVAGAAHKAQVSITGSGSMTAPAFQAGDVSISIMGSGNARLKATGSADVSIMGSGDAEIAGGAKCNVSKLGSGSARCTA